MQQSCTEKIVVFRGPLRGVVRKLIESPTYRKSIQFFLEDELGFDLMQHSYIPQHTLLTDQERDELLQRYHVKLTQLPRIAKSDPVAKHFNASVGQVFRIERDSETAGRYVSYRVVVP